MVSCTNPILRQRIHHLKLYPLVLMVCYFWISLYRILIMAGITIDSLTTIIYFF
jgi:hypothetical protein